MKVPFVDLQTQYADLEEEILPAVQNIFRRAAFILGDEVQQFEKDFAAFSGARHGVGVNSGCDALLVALKTLDIGPGDEVITVANTFIATVLAISAAGATPVLVDCLEDTYQIDPGAIEGVITPKTKAIIPVHLCGQPADMDPILAIAEKHGLHVVEDAAQAHGATYKGRLCGSMGAIGCFSFFPGKNLGAYGDGGALVTNDESLAERAGQYRNYGQRVKYHHDMVGWNARLDTVQAAVLSTKLKRLPDWNEARRRHAAAYRERLGDLPLTFQKEVPDTEHVYHLFIVRCDGRDELLSHLQSKDIGCGIHYPIPVHLQKGYTHLGYAEGSFPVAEKLAKQILSLPMFPEMTEEQIAYTCETVRAFMTVDA